MEAGITVFIGHEGGEHPRGRPGRRRLHGHPRRTTPSSSRRARSAVLSIWHRAQMLAHLGVGLDTLAVAGTHGKTTTSSMLASALDALRAPTPPSSSAASCAPTAPTPIPAPAPTTWSRPTSRTSPSRTSRLRRCSSPTSRPTTWTTTRDLDEIYEKFATTSWASVSRRDGVVVACGDDAQPGAARPCRRAVRMFTYGFDEGCRCAHHVLRAAGHWQRAMQPLELPDGHAGRAAAMQAEPGAVTTSLNAAGVITLLWALGFDAGGGCSAPLSGFAGVRRRFDLVGEVARRHRRGRLRAPSHRDRRHHRRGIGAWATTTSTCCSSRIAIPVRPCSPRCSTTSSAPPSTRPTRVTFMDVYPAGEAPVPGVSGKTFLNVVLEHEGHPQDRILRGRVASRSCPYLMAKLVQPGDLVITMGAGDVTAIGPAARRTRWRVTAPATRPTGEPGARRVGTPYQRRWRRCSSTSAFDADVLSR